MAGGTVGSYEAKTHLARLLDRVEEGERITITRHGVPVAALVPVSPQPLRSPNEAIDELRLFRAGRRLGPDLSLRDLVDEGRS